MVYTLALLAVAASVVSAATPPGFQPAVNTELVVDFGNTLIDGQVVPKNLVASQPQIGTTQRLTGSSYAVIMVDLDIPTNNPAQTSTLLHWLQTGLTPSTQATRLGGNTGGNGGGNGGNSGVQSVFLLRNGSGQAPAAAYISPNPPARLPLSHTYAQVLVDTSGAGVGAQSTALTTLTSAAQTRQNFDVQQVLSRAGLANKVVAANFFNVTNPGPVQQQQAGQQDGALSSQSGNDTSASTSSTTTTTTYGSTDGGSGTISDSTTTTSASSSAVVKSGAAGPLSVVSGTAAVAGLVALLLQY